MKIAIAGAAGRMGRTLTRIASETSGIEIAGGLESSGSPQVGSDMGELAGICKLPVKVRSDPVRLLSTKYAARRKFWRKSMPLLISPCRKRRWLWVRSPLRGASSM